MDEVAAAMNFKQSQDNEHQLRAKNGKMRSDLAGVSACNVQLVAFADQLASDNNKQRGLVSSNKRTLRESREAVLAAQIAMELADKKIADDIDRHTADIARHAADIDHHATIKSEAKTVLDAAVADLGKVVDDLAYAQTLKPPPAAPQNGATQFAELATIQAELDNLSKSMNPR
jgi:hypothetical protein